jgi:MSHA pilin protein MshD
MIENQNRSREIIPEEIMLARLEQSEQMRAFFIEMWKQNPNLAKQGGARVNNLMKSLEFVDDGVSRPEFTVVPVTLKQSGFSLIELIVFIVIVSTAMIGILSVMNLVNKNSADPVIHKQALAIAESLLEEIELQDFTAASGTTSAGTVTVTNRANSYHVISEYQGFSMTGITSLNGAAGTTVQGLSGYSALVAVQGQALGGIPATSAVQITVTVTDPAGNKLQSVGYRVAY